MDTNTDKPDADSQFRLLPCGKCRNDDVVYKRTVTCGKTQFFVKCCGCGQRTNMHSCKHDAQVEWNERFGGKASGKS